MFVFSIDILLRQCYKMLNLLAGDFSLQVRYNVFMLIFLKNSSWIDWLINHLAYVTFYVLSIYFTDLWIVFYNGCKSSQTSGWNVDCTPIVCHWVKRSSPLSLPLNIFGVVFAKLNDQHQSPVGEPMLIGWQLECKVQPWAPVPSPVQSGYSVNITSQTNDMCKRASWNS